MNAWSPSNYTLPLAALGASLTDEPISRPFSITASGSQNMVVSVKCSSVTAGAGITAKLQSGIDGTWFDSKTVAVTTNGYVHIKLNVQTAGDQTYLPLHSSGRVVITTGAGSAVTIDTVNVLQGQ